MNLVEEISLPNGLIVEVWDKSRLIAENTTRVELLIKVKVEIKDEYFSDPEHCNLVKRIFGPEVFYEYTNEKSFVPTRDKDKIFKELLDVFKKNSIPYMGLPGFPSRFVMTKLDHIQKNPWKYQNQ